MGVLQGLGRWTGWEGESCYKKATWEIHGDPTGQYLDWDGGNIDYAETYVMMCKTEKMQIILMTYAMLC